LIRVPYYSKFFKEENKDKGDSREIEPIDPIFKVKQEDTIRLRIGVPLTL